MQDWQDDVSEEVLDSLKIGIRDVEFYRWLRVAIYGILLPSSTAVTYCLNPYAALGLVVGMIVIFTYYKSATHLNNLRIEVLNKASEKNLELDRHQFARLGAHQLDNMSIILMAVLICLSIFLYAIVRVYGAYLVAMPILSLVGMISIGCAMVYALLIWLPEKLLG